MPSSEDEGGTAGFEEADGVEVFVVEKILKSRKRGKFKTEFLVKWENYDNSHNSWEPEVTHVFACLAHSALLFGRSGAFAIAIHL